MSAANLEFRVGADKSALTHRETAKEARSTSSCSFAPWGEGKDEGFHERRKIMTRPLTLTLSPRGEEIYDVTRHEAAEPASCKYLVP